MIEKPSLFAQAKKAKSVAESYTRQENQRSERGMSPWPVYDTSMFNMLNRFGLERYSKEESFNELENLIEGLRSESVPSIIGVDLMGQGLPCHDIGCDKSYGVTIPLSDAFVDS